MDKAWSGTTWENSALAEYERIASACEGGDSSQRLVLHFTYKQGEGKTWDEKADSPFHSTRRPIRRKSSNPGSHFDSP